MAHYTGDHVRRFEALDVASQARRVHPRKPVAIEVRDLRLLVALARPEIERVAAELPDEPDAADQVERNEPDFGDGAANYVEPTFDADRDE